MNEPESIQSEISEKVEEVLSQSKYRFLIMIFVAICISAGLVSISMSIYNSSGAAQLDLSRPGYQDVRDQADKNDNGLIDFSDIGPINQTILDNYYSQYKTQSDKIKIVNAFSTDPLSPEALGISSNSGLQD